MAHHSDAAAANREPCDACTSGGLLPGQPKGGPLQTLGTMKYYLAVGSGGDPCKGVIIATDMFGLGIPNPCIVADYIAEATGFSVYVPDLLEGDHPPLDKIVSPIMETPINHLPLLTRVRIVVGSAVIPFLRHAGPTFYWRHRMGVTIPLFNNFAKALQDQKGITSFALVGYCLGGQLATHVASSTDLPLSAVMVAHPGPLSASDFAAVRCPFALICSGEDLFFDHVKVAAIAALKTAKDGRGQNVPMEVYEHPGTTHGFASRPDITAPVTKAAYSKALDQTVGWIKAHL